MVVFNGTVKVRVLECKTLKPTEWSKRLASRANVVLDSYCNVDLDDEVHLGSTRTMAKSNDPKWDEEFSAEVHSGKVLGFTIFHDCAIPPDEFVANCRVYFDDLQHTSNDFWMDLEPGGRLHIVVELNGTTADGWLLTCFPL